ncbi:MAG: hypothetical protein J2P46_03215 [Zavarzinella sp.]|nr:hypothetical protein [Zavarzinella sp.]
MRLRLIPLLAVCALAGCSKIHEQRSYSIEPGASQTLKITAPLSETRYKVAMTSDQPISIWVLLEKAVPGGKDEIEPETLKEGVLGKELNTKDATLTVVVPGKEAFRIQLAGANKTANVTVKIDSQ